MQRQLFLATLGSTVIVPHATLAATPVRVAYAGSLATVMEHLISPAFAAAGGTFAGEGKGSLALANLIRQGLRIPDVFVSADPAVIESLRVDPMPTVSWYATFATTRMTIAYSRASRFRGDFEAVARGERSWTSLFAIPRLRIARTDPALDPKGYRVLQVAQLAEKRERLPGFVQRAFGEPRNPDQIYPEEAALVRLESGEIDGIFAYAVEAISRKLPAIELPPQINLGNPAFAAEYATASVRIEGIVRTGAPIYYAITIPKQAANPAGAIDFITFLLGTNGKTILEAAGLVTTKSIFFGAGADIPARIKSL